MHRTARSPAILASLLAIVAGFALSSVSQTASAAPSRLSYIRIDGATGGGGTTPGSEAGISVAGVGDINGDGRPDVIVGAPGDDDNGRQDSGSAYVVFGQVAPTTIDLANLGPHGFRIDGPRAGALAGSSVSGAGDVNGDDRPDLLVGAPGIARPSSEEAPRNVRGRVFVVFGKASPGPVDLARLGSGGFEVVGKRFFFPDGFGLAVAGAGDVNHDGLQDVIAAAPGNSGFEENVTPGTVYVIYGRRSSREVSVGRLGRRGFRVIGANLPESVAAAGDVNGDRRSDVIIGDQAARARGQARGVAYVVFGRRSSRTINLKRLGRRGFQIQGAERLDEAGASVSGAGDVNHDRLSDVVVGAPGAGQTGAAYVVFGQRSTRAVSLVVRGRPGLPRLGSHGFKITGEPSSQAGTAVAGVGDVNADGRPDVAVAALTGSLYALFGKSSRSEVPLSALDNLGFEIERADYDPGGSGPFLGSIARAGDVNGDGRADIILGDPNASHNGRDRSGSAYVFFSPR